MKLNGRERSISPHNRAIKSLYFTVILMLWAALGRAYGQYVTSSDHYGDYNSAHFAFDGDNTTRWQSKQDPKESWLSYDFGRVVELNNMTILWQWFRAKEYSIESSDNGSDWKTVYTKESGSGDLDSLSNIGFKGRFLRVHCTKYANGGWYSILEINFLDQEAKQIAKQRQQETEKEYKAKASEALSKLDFEEIVFAVRQRSNDYVWGHWYANFAYYCLDPSYKNYGKEGRLCRYNIKTGKLISLINDPNGTVRDPQLDYDGKKILFSWRRSGSEHFHLYEIDINGTNLRQLTSGPYADIEPTYLPDGSIIFVSSRCNRWVNCWQVPVASLYKCDANGGGIHQLSANIEHDNTPWVLPDGRIVYTRWEYIDRSQIHYHHLWAMKPDGTNQMVYFGNLNPGNVLIDAKPIEGSSDIVLSTSPGHGTFDHQGYVSIADASGGPDDLNNIKDLTSQSIYCDPYSISSDMFIAAGNNKIYFIDKKGNEYPIYTLPEEFGNVTLQEPRPLASRKREPIIPSRVDMTKETGTLLVNDIYYGRNMEGIEKGDIKELLILEALPKPCQFTGSMEPISWGGTFTFERVLGTVPVEEDGSVHMELPANRSLIFVALDENQSSVKRMQSFTSVMPGETTSCIGCHENRTDTPLQNTNPRPMALQSKAHTPKPVEGVPGVIDYPRDIQPILDRHCVECHNPENYNGKILLTGDKGPIYSHSYYNLKARGEYVMGRNKPVSNYAPRTIGDGASRLMRRLDGSHHSAKLSEEEIKLIRYWINTGAAYPGTYAALGTGSIGLNEGHLITDRSDLELPEVQSMKSVIENNCASCHSGETQLATHPTYIHIEAWVIEDRTWDTNFMRDIVYNLSTPEQSLLLMAPLAKDKGGYADATTKEEDGHPIIFKDKNDPRYKTILKGIEATSKLLNERKRFDMPGFKPRAEYVREMKKFGILPDSFDVDKDSIDVYETDQRYWESLWYYPDSTKRPHLYNNRYPITCETNPSVILQQGEKHTFICADYGLNKVREYDRDGRVIWEHEAGTCTDVTKLANGNVLFATGKAAVEVTPGHMEIFRYESKGELYSCQRLENGNTLIAESLPLRICELSPNGEIVKEVPLKCESTDTHWMLRHARKTSDGTYLVGHLGDNLAREYDETGKIIRDFKAPGHVFMGERLKDGNTLVTWQCGVIEFDTKGEIVWELTKEDIKEMNPMFILGAERLDNGNTIICNWLGWEGKGESTPLFEVNREKEIVWRVSDNKQIGAITFLQLLK